MQTVILDLDGTLADTSRDLIAAANWCFEDLGFGRVLDPVADASVAFRGGRKMLEVGFGRIGAAGADFAASVEREYPRLLKAYEANIDRETVLYPGALQAVEALTCAGYALGICTNKPEALAELLLARLGVRDLFASLVGAGTLPVRKPHAAPLRAAVERAGGTIERSMLVGDTFTDRETARAAGVPCVLVTFGPDGDSVADLAPEALLEGFDALPDIVRRLIG